MSDSYIVNNLRNLAMSIRKNAALTFSETYTEDLDTFISIHQVETLIQNNSITDDGGALIIDEDQYDNIFEQVRDWIYNVGLAKLAAEDKIQCAWDDTLNVMIFWNNDKPNNVEKNN